MLCIVFCYITLQTSGDDNSGSSPASSAGSDKIKERQRLSSATKTGGEPSIPKLSKRLSQTGSARSTKDKPQRGNMSNTTQT